MEERDAITETAISPELLAKAVQAILRLEPAQAVTLRGRAEAILDMLLDEGIVEGIVETGVAIQARLDAYVELMSCPAMAEFHPARGEVSEECVLRAISQAPLRLRDGRYRFCIRQLVILLSEGAAEADSEKAALVKLN